MKFQGGIPLVVIAACMLAVPPIYAGQDAREPDSERAEWIFFVSEERLGAIRPDGTGEHYPDFGLPALRLWRMHSVSLDGREAELLTPDSGKWWSYDFVAKTIREIPGPLGVPLPGGERFARFSNADNVFSVFSTDRHGGNREDICSGAGFAYCTNPSPDGHKVAYHITGTPGRPGYEIYVLDLLSKDRVLIAGDHKYLHFCPTWSPDGQWLLYQRCEHLQDPGHDRSDLCISRPDGSQHRVLTGGQRHWFAAAVGTPQRHSSGSNMPVWSPDGRWITCALLLPDSRTAWPWATDRPDTGHFNRDYHPEQARGGTQICLLDPETGKLTPLTHDAPPTWNFRLAWSPDGSQLAYLRADVGCLPELWVMDADGGNRRRLTRGLNAMGADHPRWTRLVRGVSPGTPAAPGGARPR